MIIDLILDRRANEKDIALGLTHYRTYPNPSGKKFGQIELNDGSILVPFAYNAKDFYNELQSYGEIFGTYLGILLVLWMEVKKKM